MKLVFYRYRPVFVDRVGEWTYTEADGEAWGSLEEYQNFQTAVLVATLGYDPQYRYCEFEQVDPSDLPEGWLEEKCQELDRRIAQKQSEVRSAQRSVAYMQGKREVFKELAS